MVMIWRRTHAYAVDTYPDSPGYEMNICGKFVDCYSAMRFMGAEIFIECEKIADGP